MSRSSGCHLAPRGAPEAAALDFISSSRSLRTSASAGRSKRKPEVSVSVVKPPGDVRLLDDSHNATSSLSAGEVLGAYVALTKPRIVELLLLTTVPVMFLAERGVPSFWLVVATVVGGTLAAGSANALNCVVDRDIDQQMRRTRRRPLPRHRVSARSALVFGLALGMAGTLLLGFTVNWLSSALALAANVFYVVGYTILLKRRTPQNIVWGGAAGCFPALIGWTAVTGSLAWTPVVLFLVVFFWTPPHFWSLAIRYRDDYATAAVPMLPVVASSAEVGRQITVYTWITVAASLALWPVASTGWLYPVVAAVLGGAFIAEAHGLWRRSQLTEDPVELKAMRLFHGSNAYLALLFLAVALDSLITS
ncbi:MAG: heme o synthase [Nocardioidaceae bacterium]